MTIAFIGAYRVAVPFRELRAALRCHEGDREAVREELDSLVLVELEVMNAWPDFRLSLVNQAHTSCVPYNEDFFDIQSLNQIYPRRNSELPGKDFRVAFHLHYFNPSVPLNTPCGPVRVGPATDPPPHLAKKKYRFWD
jgi:hypothetical protein